MYRSIRYSDLDILCMAQYAVAEQCTIRKVGVEFNISKSTVHNLFRTRLSNISLPLYIDVINLLDRNKAERHIRGGAVTQKKYAACKN